MIKRSYASPKRVEKSTQKMISGSTFTGKPVGKPDNILNGLSRSLRGPNHHQTQIENYLDPSGSEPINFNDDVPTSMEDFARATFFDKSDDRLGRLAEINKSQM